MNYEKIEKLLIKPTLNSINQIGFFKQKSEKPQSGFLYTGYRGHDEKIVIGFTYSMKTLISKQRNLGFNLVGKRNGLKNDESILKGTLLELGYHQSKSDGSYNYSLELLRHLEMLGWPIEGIYHSQKNRIYNYKSKK